MFSRSNWRQKLARARSNRSCRRKRRAYPAADRPATSRETNSRVREEAQVARHRILLKVVNAFARAFERDAEREPGAQRVAVGFHVAHHDKRRTARAARRRLLRSSQFASYSRSRRTLSAGSDQASALRAASWPARSRVRSSDLRRTISPGVWRRSILCPSSPRRNRAACWSASSDWRADVPVADDAKRRPCSGASRRSLRRASRSRTPAADRCSSCEISVPRTR